MSDDLEGGGGGETGIDGKRAGVRLSVSNAGIFLTILLRRKRFMEKWHKNWQVQWE